MCKADPDIAGIGTIVSFAVTGLLNLGLAFAYLVIDNKWNAQASRIDKWVSSTLGRRNYSTVTQKKRNFWLRVIQKVVLALSDQQLLTGLAILIAGLCQLCSISVYHFSVVSDLAWFSSSVHFTTLGILEGYFREEKRRTYRNWRVILMCVMCMLMVATLVMQGHKAWSESWNSPAQCLINDLVGNVSGLPAFWMFFNILLLLYGYTSTILYLYESCSVYVHTWLFENPAKCLYRNIEHYRHRGQRHFYSALLANVLRFIHLLLLLIQEVFYSQCISTIFDVLWFSLGLHWILTDRTIPASEIDGNENELTFGQIVPILLLSSTILTMREAYDDEERKKEDLPDSSAARNSVSTSASNPDLCDSPKGRQMIGSISFAHVDREAESISVPLRRIDTEGGCRVAASAVDSQNFVLGTQRKSFPL